MMENEARMEAAHLVKRIEDEAREQSKLEVDSDGLDFQALIRAGKQVVGISSPAISGTTLRDSATLNVVSAEPDAPRGGPGDVANVQDSASLVIRDAQGKVKYKGIVN